MSRMINLTSSGFAEGEGEKKSTIKKKMKIGPVSINFVTIIIIALITLFYLAQTQIGTSKKGQISELERQKEDIKREIERLEVEAASARSISNISGNLESLNMVPVKNINYIVEAD